MSGSARCTLLWLLAIASIKAVPRAAKPSEIGKTVTVKIFVLAAAVCGITAMLGRGQNGSPLCWWGFWRRF